MRPACRTARPRGTVIASAASAIAIEMERDRVNDPQGLARRLIVGTDLEGAHQLLACFAPAPGAAEAARQLDVPDRVGWPERNRDPELFDGGVPLPFVGQGLAQQ